MRTEHRLSPSDVLKLTGQEHPEGFKYDKVVSVWESETTSTRSKKSCMGAVGINEAEKRIVDIAVHPDYRRLGIGHTLVLMSGCHTAYVIDPEAEKFWWGIGWSSYSTTTDKGTVVTVFKSPDEYERLSM